MCLWNKFNISILCGCKYTHFFGNNQIISGKNKKKSPMKALLYEMK